MTHISPIHPDNATGEVADFYREAGVSQIMQCFSLRPDFGKVMNHAASVIHFQKGFLSRRDHEAIATYVSSLNHCPFCLDSHAAFLRLQGENDSVAFAIAEANLDKAAEAGLEPKRRKMLEFAGKIALESAQIISQDISLLHEHGYDDEQIAEMVYIAASFAFFNRVANSFGIVSTEMINLPVEQIRKMTSRP